MKTNPSSNTRYSLVALAVCSPLFSLWSPHLKAQTAQSPDDEHPFGLQVEEQISYDSNPYRLPAESTAPGQSSPEDKGDFFSLTQARLRYTYRGEGNTLNLQYVPGIVRYHRFSQLDHERESAGIRWEITPAEHTSVATTYLHTRLPSNLADQLTTTPNMVTSDTLSADVNVGGRGQWQFISGISGNSSTNSDSVLEVADRYGWSAYAGARRLLRSGSSADLRYRYTWQHFPNGAGVPAIDSGYRQDELASGLDWRASGISQVSGQLSYLNRKHDTFPDRDFSGWAGNMRYVLSLSALSSVSVEAYRQLGEISEASASYARDQGLRLAYVWKPGEKLSVTPSVDWRFRRYNNVGGIQKPDETKRIYAVTSAYALTPSVALNTTIGTESRKSQASSSRYSATYANLQVVWKIR